MNDIGDKTGRYRIGKDGTLEKISRPGFIPAVAFDGATCPTSGYVSENLGHDPVFVRSRRHKKDLLKQQGLCEAF